MDGSIVKDVVDEMKEEIKSEMTEHFEKKFDEMSKKVEKKHKDQVDRLKRDMDKLMMDNETLRENLATKQKTIKNMQDTVNRSETIAKDAQKKANYNEQYSRKNNVKIHGIKEADNENTLETVKKELLKTAKVKLEDSEVIAVHRLPVRDDQITPILLKVKNSDIKARIMRTRPTFKKAGKRLSDDVTKINSELIQKLNDHEGIEQAWYMYFNGSVFAKTEGPKGRRMKFDIHDDIAEKIKKK